MPSKSVTSRQKDATMVQAACTTHAPKVAQPLARDFGPLLEASAALPDVETLMKLCGELLGKKMEDLLEAEKSHEREQSEDSQVRSVRDDKKEACVALIVETRATLHALFPTEQVEALNLKGATPYHPVAIVRFARDLAQKLTRFPLTPSNPHVQIDLEAIAAQLVQRAADLEESLQELATELRESEQSKNARDLALAEFDQSYSRVAWLVSGLLKFAGEDELARKLRPRRPGKGHGPIEPTEPTPTPPSPTE